MCGYLLILIAYYSFRQYLDILSYSHWRKGGRRPVFLFLSEVLPSSSKLCRFWSDCFWLSNSLILVCTVAQVLPSIYGNMAVICITTKLSFHLFISHCHCLNESVQLPHCEKSCFYVYAQYCQRASYVIKANNISQSMIELTIFTVLFLEPWSSCDCALRCSY